MKSYNLTFTGTCSKGATVYLDEDNTLAHITFDGGCPGFSKALVNLLLGKKPSQVIPLLRGITCKGKSTSCPDQFATELAKLNL